MFPKNMVNWPKIYLSFMFICNDQQEKSPLWNCWKYKENNALQLSKGVQEGMHKLICLFSC